jgi:class I fructose-bisphosphate aldolase
VRQTVELGADIVKADPTSTPEQFHRVIEVAGGTPVMVRGGGRVSDREILERTAELMRHGLAGIVYGRNILQHPDPTGMTQALMAVVHEGATAEQALEALRATA